MCVVLRSVFTSCEDDAKVHVDIAARIRQITLGSMDSKCHPESDPTDKLAALRQKERRKGVANPFPYLPIEDFLPCWAQKARVFLHCTLRRTLAGPYPLQANLPPPSRADEAVADQSAVPSEVVTTCTSRFR